MFIKIYYDPYSPPSMQQKWGETFTSNYGIVVKSLILNSRLLFYFALLAYKNLIYIPPCSFIPSCSLIKIEEKFHPAR